jgi:hypothetical protein
MLGTEMTRKYYLISDLHMGGDGQLQHCDYTAEFIAFLKGLEKEDSETELLIVSDTFGFWELTLVLGTEKLDHIIKAHQAIFDQLKVVGARIRVTMMVGNHDYDLACDPAYVDKLAPYNIIWTRAWFSSVSSGERRSANAAFPIHSAGQNLVLRYRPLPSPGRACAYTPVVLRSA